MLLAAEIAELDAMPFLAGAARQIKIGRSFPGL